LGGAKTETVGGGPSTGLANDFTSFLRTGLREGFGQPQQQGQMPAQGPSGFFNPQGGFGSIGTLPGFFGNAPVLKDQGFPGGGPVNGTFGSLGNTGFNQNTPQTNFATANPLNQTNTVGGAINNQLSGNITGGPTSVDTSGLKNMANQPGFQFGNLQLPNVDYSQFNTGGIDAIGNQLQNFNANQPGFNSNIAGNPGLQNALGNLTNASNSSLEYIKSLLGGNVGPGAGTFNATLGPVDTSAEQNFLAREQAKGQADLRARFGAGGGASFGTPAAFAEGNFLAESGARNAAALADITRQYQGLDLQRQLGEGQINTQRIGDLLNAQSNARGIGAGLFGSGISGLASGANTLADVLGTSGQLNLGARGQDIQSSGLNLDAIARAGQLAGQAGQLNLDALNAQSAQQTNAGQLFNQNQGIQAGNQIDNRNAAINALGQALGIDFSGLQLGQQQQQFNAQNQGNIIGQLLAAFQNLSLPGIPQAQTVSKPSTAQNILSGVTGLIGAASPGFNIGG